jgi:hypothetical protein
MKQIQVIKKNGERELYSEEKVVRSLQNSGADEKIINDILKKLNKILHDGISTKEIFSFVFRELRRRESSLGARYNLKQGIIEMSLGGGYVFEKFMGKVFQKMGYAVELNKTIKGKNIEHEIDVIVKKGSEVGMVECKHFSKPELGVSIQTALYVYARFLDVKNLFNKVFLATNTKFSPQVIKYSKGVGVNLIGWRYPQKESLELLIGKYKIYPITILPISKSRMRIYLEKEILTFEDLLKIPDLSSKLKKIIEDLMK